MIRKPTPTPASEAAVTLPSRDENDTFAIAAAVARLCIGGDVIALHGELGAGKTRFVRGLAAGMGLEPGDVSSPTFTIMQEYEAADAPLVLVHMDAYRLTGPDDLASIGWEGTGEAFREAAVIAVEWASRIEAALPADVLHVEIEHTGDTSRKIIIRGTGTWRERVKVLSREI